MNPHLWCFAAAVCLASQLMAADPVQVLAVQFPQPLVWGHNVATVTVRNSDDRPHELEIDSQCRTDYGGTGRQTRRTLAARSEESIAHGFEAPAFPGRMRHRLRVVDATAGRQAFQAEYWDEFPMANTRVGSLRPPELFVAKWKLRSAYPPLRFVEYGHFVVYYLQDDAYAAAHAEEVARRRETIYAGLAAKLNPGFHQRILLYLFPDGESKLAYTAHQGDGLARQNLIAEVFNAARQLDPHHELAHIVGGSVGSPPALFNEGFAAYVQEGHRWNGYAADAWSKAFAEAGLLVPLPELIGYTDIGPDGTRPGITYPESASVVGYLIDTYGFERFLEAYRELKQDGKVEENTARFARIFGASLAEVEQGWRARLRESPIEPPPPAAVDAVRR